MTAGPGSSQADCSAGNRRWDSIGEGVQLVWSGSEKTGSGSTSFDLESVALTYGDQAPLLCLSVVAAEEGLVCQAEGCPEYAIGHVTRLLDSAVLAVETSSPPATVTVTATFDPVQVLSPPPTPQSCQRGKSRQRKGRTAMKGKIGLAQQTLAEGRGQRVRECKTG